MKIIPYHGHYVILDDNGNFFGSADTYLEAERDMELTTQN